MNAIRKEFTVLAGFVGAAMALSGYIRHTIQDVWGWFNLSLLIVGGVLLLASVILNFKDILGYFTGRTGKLSANMAILTVAVIGLIAIANYLGYRHHKRIDLTSEGLYSLSDQTKKVLKNLPKEVKVYKFDQTPDQRLADEMAEFSYVTNKISYEYVDPVKRPEIARQYAVKSYGETVVTAGDRTERPSATDEQAMVNAILKVTRDTLKTVCFTEGHEEKSLTEAFSAVESKLKAENYQTKTVNLAQQKEKFVPSECAVLVVAGPKTAFLQPETSMIGQYLDNGGKAMFLIDPDTDPQLNDVLKKWSIELGNDLVLDFSAAGQVFGPAAPIVNNYATHPITENFARGMTVFPQARSVKVISGGSGVNSTTLLTGSPNSYGETDLKANAEPKYDEGKDTKGPVSVGAVASKNLGENKEARLVVIGDSDFASNQAFRVSRNGDLFMNSINWLAQDEDLISIRPKLATNRSVTMNAEQQNTFWILVVIFMPLAALGAGAFVWWKRR